MAVTVQYGPIAGALGLAQRAGAGQGYNLQAQRDLQALQLQAQMQGQINSNNANLIQMALARDELAARQAQNQAQLQQQAIYRQAQQQIDQQQLSQNAQRLDQQQQQFSAEQKTREEQAKSLAALRTQQTADKTTRDAWLKSLSPEDFNTVMSGGQLNRPAPIGTTSAEREQVRRERELTRLQDETFKLRSMLLEKGVLMAPEDKQTVEQMIQANTKKIDEFNAATGSRTQAPRQPAQMDQTLPPVASAGKMLRDKETGKVYRSDGRQWIPLN